MNEQIIAIRGSHLCVYLMIKAKTRVSRRIYKMDKFSVPSTNAKTLVKIIKGFRLEETKRELQGNKADIAKTARYNLVLSSLFL